MERVRNNIIYVIVLIITLILICLFMYNFRDKIFPDRVIAISEEDARRKQYGYATEAEMDKRLEKAEYKGRAPMTMVYDHGIVIGNMDKNTDISITSNTDDEAVRKVMSDMMKAAKIKDYELRTVTIDITKKGKQYEPVSFLKVYYDDSEEDPTYKYDSCLVYYIKDGEVYYLKQVYTKTEYTRSVSFSITDCNTYCLVYINEKDLEGLEDAKD